MISGLNAAPHDKCFKQRRHVQGKSIQKRLGAGKADFASSNKRKSRLTAQGGFL